MPLAAGLRAILDPDVVVQATEADSVELRDRRSGMKVRIFGLPARFTVVHVEGIGHMGKLRDRGSEHDGHLRRICDYLLVVESGDDTRVVFVELKETWSNGEKPRDQLRRSLPLLKYIRSVCEVEYGETQDARRISIHYSIVFEKSSRKFNMQSVSADPAQRTREEEYKGITIRTFVGTSVPLATLTGE